MEGFDLHMSLMKEQPPLGNQESPGRWPASQQRPELLGKEVEEKRRGPRQQAEKQACRHEGPFLKGGSFLKVQLCCGWLTTHCCLFIGGEDVFLFS